MKLVELTLPCYDQHRVVTAVQVTDHFAIHDTVGGRPSISVTHTPTLRRMAIVEGLAVGIAACEAWQRTGIDWSFSDPNGLVAVPEDRKEMARHIRDFAESGALDVLRSFAEAHA